MAGKNTRSRIVDQKGQWKSTTPATTKKRQAKELEKLAGMLKAKEKKK